MTPGLALAPPLSPRLALLPAPPRARHGAWAGGVERAGCGRWAGGGAGVPDVGAPPGARGAAGPRRRAREPVSRARHTTQTNISCGADRLESLSGEGRAERGGGAVARAACQVRGSPSAEGGSERGMCVSERRGETVRSNQGENVGERERETVRLNKGMSSWPAPACVLEMFRPQVMFSSRSPPPPSWGIRIGYPSIRVPEY